MTMEMNERPHDRRPETLKQLRLNPEFEAKRREAWLRYLERAKERDVNYGHKMTAAANKAAFKRAAKSRAANAKRYSDPEQVEKERQRMKERWASGHMQKFQCGRPGRYTPEGLAKQREAHDRSRGFSIPAHKMDDYRALMKKFGMRAREAGRILGLI